MSGADRVELPRYGASALASLLERRRTTRVFRGGALALSDLSSLLWAGSGMQPGGSRVVPSAHALHRLSIAVIAGDVAGLSSGAYLYSPEDHALVPAAAGDHRAAIAATTLVDAEWVARAPVQVIATGEIDALTRHFEEQPPRGRRGERYAWMEAGHVSQNLYLAAADLDLPIAVVGGFDDEGLASVLHALLPSLPHGSRPLAILPAGPSDH
ncbi:SagB/ThcOx family dehydrogenase [Microbacterium sp. LRZ72]|uniref:SagB/ThcOx family dehydrogenase n=1 Tax=Microbacterium sp. LRZ72 TaxID=2942481 RepID=UPI0029A29F81|nr:SagB/ThcOx family dehydrogenase [Microbacterium sp. LRZ72]MDX2375428.1 SagB/ThcOx family dehydrogenase [Microbacterium sp. LRZ72]